MKGTRNSAKAIIINEGRLLAIKKKDKDSFCYGLPGGGQEHGEDLISTLKRECLEEINAHIEAKDLKFVSEYIAQNHEDGIYGDLHKIDFMFDCFVKNINEIKIGSTPDNKQVDIEWLDIQNLQSYNFFPQAVVSHIQGMYEKGRTVYLGDVE